MDQEFEEEPTTCTLQSPNPGAKKHPGFVTYLSCRQSVTSEAVCPFCGVHVPVEAASDPDA